MASASMPSPGAAASSAGCWAALSCSAFSAVFGEGWLFPSEGDHEAAAALQVTMREFAANFRS